MSPNDVRFHRTEATSRSAARSRAAVERLRHWLSTRAPGGAVVLTRPGSVGWATGGAAPAIDRGSPFDPVWVVVTDETVALVTTDVERARVTEEYAAAMGGLDTVASAPWYDPPALVRIAEQVAGRPADRLLTDGHPAFGPDASSDLVALRLALSAPERVELAELGELAARALQQALVGWRPGERDLDIQGRVAAILESAGADSPVLIVGGDERVTRYRHPVAVGAPIRHLAMAVVVARRGGLHVAATRFASAGALSADLRELRRRVLRVERRVLAATRPGAVYGEVLEALDLAYAEIGHERAWAEHYQGGPIGYAQREFEIAPGQHTDRWYAEPVAEGHAVAWNPSLPGGAKVEDTYLIDSTGPSPVTRAAGWPVEPGEEGSARRPAVLDILSGSPA